jgi:hypothetical protein
MENFTKNLQNILEITEKKDLINIEIFVKNIEQVEEFSNVETFKEKFLKLFEGVNTYSQDQETKYQSKIKRVRKFL